jgi:hypothetical protein
VDLHGLDARLAHQLAVVPDQARRGEEDDDLVGGVLLGLGQQGVQEGEVLVQGQDRRGLRHLDVRVRLLLPHGIDELVVGAHGQAGHLLDTLGHGGAEKEGLAGVGGQEADDLLNGRSEAHVQQLVRLVQDEDAQVLEVRRQAIVLQVVHQPTRRRHQNVRAPAQEAVALRVDVGAAVAEIGLELALEGQELGSLHMDLLGQLPRGRQDKHRNAARARGRLPELLQGRDAKG